MELEYGTVKFFDDRDNKKFGFLFVLDEKGKQTGEEIFLHYNDGQWVDVVEDEIQFIGRISLRTGLFLHLPQAGVKLVFKRQLGKQGNKACPWTYAAGYDECLRQLTEARSNSMQETS